MAQHTMDQEQLKMAEELLFTGEEKHSFAKMLFFGRFDPSHVFPFPQNPDSGDARYEVFMEQLERFADDRLDGDAFDRKALIPDDVIKEMGELGLLGMTIPREVGGLGFSQYSYCKAMEIVSRYCGSTALFVNAHQSIGLKALLLFGTEEQQRRWLPALAKGEMLAAFALTEPNAGSDASGIETRAEFDLEKNVYRINGRKQWITNGGIAGVLTVMAQTKVDTPEGAKDKVTAFLVTPDMPGFKVLNKSLEKVGMRGSQTANLAFENLEVPAENILGPKGGGLRVCLTVLDYGRTTFGATCTGAAKYLVERAVQHSLDRIQFKRPLASFPLVKEKIARMSALAYAMESSTLLTAGLVDSGLEDFMLESAMLKVFTSDSLWTILYDTMQIYGGRSFFTDQPFERMMRDARLNMIGEGSNEVMRAFIGVVGMRDVGMHLKEFTDVLKSPFGNLGVIGSFGKQCLKKFGKPDIPIASPILRREADRLASAVRRFGFAIPRLLAKYREQVVEQQLALNRIATSAMALYSATAVISRLDSELQRVKNQTNELGNDFTVGRFYCQMAFDEIDKCLSTLFRNNDTQIEDVSDLITQVDQ